MFTTEADDPNKPFCTLQVETQFGLVGLAVRDSTAGYIEYVGKVTGIKGKRINAGTHNVLCPNNSETETDTFEFNDLENGLNEAGEATGISLTHP